MEEREAIISHTDNSTVLGHKVSAIPSLQVVPAQIPREEVRHLSPMCVGKHSYV